VENVFQVVALDRLFTVEEFQEFLNELWGHIDLQGFDIDGLIYHQLKEELIDTLDVWPGGINLILLLDTCLREAEVGLLHIGQGAEDILLNHLHDLVQVGDDQGGHVLLVAEHLLKLIYGIKPIGLFIIILLIINLPCP
jgi:hypothetical protein